MSQDAWAGTLSWWSCQSPAPHSCGTLNHPNSFCRGIFNLTQNLMLIPCCTHSVILNVMATQYTCSLSPVYHPHWLVQWSCHCSHMHIPIHCPWLPGYMGVTQTILIISTMVELFLDRPHKFNQKMGLTFSLKDLSSWQKIQMNLYWNSQEWKYATQMQEG